MKFGIEVLKDQLEEMVKKKRLGHFVYALKSLSSDLRTECQALQPIFRMILEQPGCEFFVYAYVTHLAGHDTPFDTGEYPIHIAALSHQEANLKMLLSCQHSTVDQKTQPPANKTALELLCEQITRDTLIKTMKCLSVLLSYNANIPASWLDDSYPEASKRQQFLKTLSQKCNIANNEVNDFDQTLDVLVTEAQWKVRELFQTRIFPNATESQTVPEGILLKCCKIGDYDMLKYLFETLTEDQLKRLLLAKKTNEAYVEEHLLIVLMHRVNENDNDCPFYKCLTLCLSNPLIDIDDADRTDRRALDYAAKYKLKRVQKLLLEKGAYVGGRDTFGRYALCNIDPIVLKQHLDSCITYDRSGNISVRLDNFIPPQCKTKCQSSRNEESWNASDESILPALIEFTHELKISASIDRLQLLEHPVISTLLYIREPPFKWYIDALKAVRALPLPVCVVCLFLPKWWLIFVTQVILGVLYMYEVFKNGAYLKNIFRCAKRSLFLADVSILATMSVEFILFTFIVGKTMVFKKPLLDASVFSCTTVLAGFAMERCIGSYNPLANHIHALDIVMVKFWTSFVVYSFIPIIFTLCYYSYYSEVNSSDVCTFVKWCIVQFKPLAFEASVLFMVLLLFSAVGNVPEQIDRECRRLKVVLKLYHISMRENMMAVFSKENKRLDILSGFYIYPYHDVSCVELIPRNNNDVLLHRLNPSRRNPEALPWSIDGEFAQTLANAATYRKQEPATKLRAKL
ncbi:uncharacterized protein LOC118506352 isoform X3 [Anopheles stephensi]|uniref:uncharacterized protein LOC118506352 isoform X3 n=1 Tax=Anopheles stephensi TaxID=30069 RepID=UPI0016588C05|nr:uncharacterized protein LOC118506352 isoform X3 [Anopheles stephensi]